MNKSLLVSTLLLLLPCFLANNISKSPATQPATSPPSSPQLKPTPVHRPPGSPVPSSEPDNKLSSLLSLAAHSSPLPPTPSPTPPHSPASPTLPMAYKNTEVLFLPLRKRLLRPGVLLNTADRPNRKHLLSLNPDIRGDQPVDPISGLPGSRPHLPPPPQLLRQCPHQLHRRRHRNYPLNQVNISSKTSTLNSYTN